MNIVHLKYFIAVAVSGSFSEAAEAMFSTQSTVSKQISSLEKDLNVQLFDRSKRKISLTIQGKAALQHAQVIIDDYNNMVKELLDLNAYDDNTVRVASTPVMLPYNILSIIANFKKSYPLVKLGVEELEGQDILRYLREGQCELAFVRGADIDEELFEKIVIYTDKLVAVLPQNHPFAQRTQISISELSKENFLLLDKGSSFFNQCVLACNQAGFSPNIVYTGHRMTNIFNMVTKDLGVGLMLKKAAVITSTDLSCKSAVIVPLTELITSDVSVLKVRHRHCNLATTYLWDFIRDNISHLNI